MKKFKIKSLLKFTFFLSIFIMLFTVKVFAGQVLYKFSTPITGSEKTVRCEIKFVVSTVKPLPAPKVTGDATMQVEVYVEGSSSTDGTLIRGLQVDMAPIKNTRLEFYDRGYLIDVKNRYEDALTDPYSKPTNSDTVVIKLLPPTVKSTSQRIFKIEQIYYTVDPKEQSGKKIDYWALPEFRNSKSIISLRNNLNRYHLGSDIISSAITNSTDGGFYKNTTADVLYFATHSNITDLWKNGDDSITLSSLASNHTSKADWIFQTSCFIVNQESAPDWCNYLSSNSNHLGKGVFGYSQEETPAYNFSDKFMKFSQMWPLLSVYMNDLGETFMKKGRSERDANLRIMYDQLAYATAIVNAENINDSMFEITKPSMPYVYRMYRFQREYGNVVITPESLGNVKVSHKTNPDNSVSVSYNFANSTDYLNIVITKPSLEAGANLRVRYSNEKKYLANYLNNLSVSDFDNLMIRYQGLVDDGFKMKDLPSDVKMLRTKNQGAYKQMVLNWLTVLSEPTIGEGIAAKRPLVKSIATNSEGIPEVEYCELMKNAGEPYKYGMENGVIKWYKDYLGRYRAGNEVVLR